MEQPATSSRCCWRQTAEAGKWRRAALAVPTSCHRRSSEPATRISRDPGRLEERSRRFYAGRGSLVDRLTEVIAHDQHQAIQEGPLAFQQLHPRLAHREPLDAVGLGERLQLA